MNNSLGDVMDLTREVLSQLLTETFLPNEEMREAAEKEIKMLEATSEKFAVQLTEILLDSGEESKVRQLAATTLQSHVETHWKNFFEEESQFCGIQLEYKERIKELLPNGLRESTSAMRSAVAQTISTIAHEDWPENWPGLYDVLVDCLSRENDFAAEEAIAVLCTCIHYVGSDQLPHVGPVVLQAMYQIFQGDNQYSFLIRSQAVEIFTSIFGFLAVPDYCQSDFIRQSLQPVIPMFCKKFMGTLKEQNELTRELNRLKTYIVKAITTLTATIPKCILDFLPEMLPLICQLLADSARECRETTEEDIEDNDVDYDEEAVDDCDSLVNAIIEFIEVFISGPCGYISNLSEYSLSDYQWFYLQDCFPLEALEHLIGVMKINDDQIQAWTSSFSQFLIEGEITVFPNNVRSRTRNLLIEIVSRPKRAAADMLVVVVLKQLEADIRLRANDANGVTQNSWKLHEAHLLAFCITKNIIIERQKAKTLYFDVVAFLENVVLADINNTECHPLLLGRCLCVGGLYVDQMPTEMKSRFLKAIVNGLENKNKCTKICAAIAANSWIHAASVRGNSDENLLKSQLLAVFDGLFDLGSRIMSPEGLKLVLESFAILLSFDKTFAISIEKKICILTITAFLNFHDDLSVLRLCEKIFKELMLYPECIEPLQARLVQILVDMMTTDPSDNPRNGKVALDVLQILVEHSPQPLSSLLIESAFPAACTCILSSVDHATLQSGSKVLRTYLSVAEQQVIDFRSSDNKTGPHYVFQVAAQLLKPEIKDAYELIKSLVKKDGTTLTKNINMKQLLLVVLNKLQCTEKIFARRLLTIFAHFINLQFKTVHDFLTTVAGPTGEDSMVFVVSEGLCKEHKSFEQDDRKTVNLALCKILEHGVTKHESLFHGENQGTEAEARTPVPILVEICKLVSSELS